MEGDCNVYAHSSLWMRPTRPDRYNAKMVYKTYLVGYNEVSIDSTTCTLVTVFFSVLWSVMDNYFMTICAQTSLDYIYDRQWNENN